MAKRLQGFIPVSEKTLQELQTIAKRQGVDFAVLSPSKKLHS
jgi:hypothetical protein